MAVIEEGLVQARLKAAEITDGISAEPIYAAVLARLKQAGAQGHILDYGAGTGNFSRRLCAAPEFHRITAADLVEYAGHFEHPKLEWIFADLNLAMAEHAQRYDAVVAVEVIEHLENPRAVAREWFNLLKPGGSILFSTPNNESWRSFLALMVKGHFAAHTDECYPNHITALLRADMKRILIEAGFQQIAFSYSNFGLIPKLTRLNWQQVSFRGLKGLRYSDNIVCSAIKPGSASDRKWRREA